MANKPGNERDHGVVVETSKPEVARPPLYSVLLLNDDYTPMDFVVDVLARFFGMNIEKATQEETGWDVRLTAFIGAYQWKAPETSRHYLRFAFLADVVAHHPERPLDTGIERALWMTPAELLDARERHRSPLVWQVVADALAGRRQPLSVLQQVP